MLDWVKGDRFRVTVSLSPVTRLPSTERGNVFLFILIGIVMFAALAMTVSRGFQSSTTSNLSKREAELAAGEILSYAQGVGRAVDRLRRAGCSETEISFENEFVSGYEHSPVTRDECKVFHPDGGGISYHVPSEEYIDATYNTLSQYQEWYFINSVCIDGVGTGAVDCHSPSNPELRSKYFELFMVLRYVDLKICEELNKSLHGSDSIEIEFNDIFLRNDLYVGDFSSLTNRRIASAQERETNCIAGSQVSSDEPPGSYHFYHVLIAR